MTGLTHRQSEILNIARAFGRVMVEDLARRFEVSAQTIRKDLNDLCDQRTLTRIHGGAIIASGVENLAYEIGQLLGVERKALGHDVLRDERQHVLAHLVLRQLLERREIGFIDQAPVQPHLGIEQLVGQQGIGCGRCGRRSRWRRRAEPWPT